MSHATSTSNSVSHSDHYSIQGFKREWAPFVLTPDFVYTMGGEVLYNRDCNNNNIRGYDL